MKELADYVNFSADMYDDVMVMFEDEAGFGRINKPKRCLCPQGVRPVVPCLHVRQYRYAFGAVEPKRGRSHFLVLPRCDTKCMNYYLKDLAEQYPNSMILLILDGASWHRSKSLIVPSNIRLFYLPPATPEMNPIEQIWKEIRKRGFKNEIFKTLEKVIDRLCDTICSLSSDTIKSIISRDWILSMI